MKLQQHFCSSSQTKHKWLKFSFNLKTELQELKMDRQLHCQDSDPLAPPWALLHGQTTVWGCKFNRPPQQLVQRIHWLQGIHQACFLHSGTTWWWWGYTPPAFSVDAYTYPSRQSAKEVDCSILKITYSMYVCFYSIFKMTHYLPDYCPASWWPHCTCPESSASAPFG